MPKADRATDVSKRSEPDDSVTEAERSVRTARWGLSLSGVAVVAVVVIAVLTELGVGLGEVPPLADDLGQRTVDVFEIREEWYLLYGRWEDLALSAAFAGLLLAVPFVKGTERFRHVLVAGSGIALVGEVIDLSQLIGIDVARFALDNDHAADFVAGNMYRIGINHTAAFVWVAGIFIVGTGMLLTAQDARPQGSWRWISALFGVALIVTGLADISANAPLVEIAEYMTAALALAWIVAAYKRATGTYRLGA